MSTPESVPHHIGSCRYRNESASFPTNDPINPSPIRITSFSKLSITDPRWLHRCSRAFKSFFIESLFVPAFAIMWLSFHRASVLLPVMTLLESWCSILPSLISEASVVCFGLMPCGSLLAILRLLCSCTSDHVLSLKICFNEHFRSAQTLVELEDFSHCTLLFSSCLLLIFEDSLQISLLFSS